MHANPTPNPNPYPCLNPDPNPNPNPTLTLTLTLTLPLTLTALAAVGDARPLTLRLEPVSCEPVLAARPALLALATALTLGSEPLYLLRRGGPP